MKKQIISLSSLLVMLTLQASAQQITFQGKIYQNGSPVNGAGTFEFFIPAPINWSETHNNVPVNNGLYAVVLGAINPIDTNLFKTSNSRQLIVRYNGNYIDTVTIYAPFERDYTVPAYIKDGIEWSEVSNKPTLDVSNTNELQTLSIIGSDSLRISQGNTVKLPTGSGSGSGNMVNGTFTVVDTSLFSLLNLQSATTTLANNDTVWQSFLATSHGKLRQIKIELAINGITGTDNITVQVFTGKGSNSQNLIGTKIISGISSSISLRTLDLTGMSPASVTINSGEVYTFKITPPIGRTLRFYYNDSNITGTDIYPNGVSGLGESIDLLFELLIDHSNPPTFSVNSNSYVGVGTNNPTSQLEVNGRIKDATGYVMPVGSIIPFAGSNIPEGWLLCDGGILDQVVYAELFTAIDTAWGAGLPSVQDFNLPDLRGMFLRGVDSSALGMPSPARDPDRSASTNNGADGKRYALNQGGNKGTEVGSYQEDTFESHYHDGPSVSSIASGAIMTGAPMAGLETSKGWFTGWRGGSETRPKNAYVNYIIKY